MFFRHTTNVFRFSMHDDLKVCIIKPFFYFYHSIIISWTRTGRDFENVRALDQMKSPVVEQTGQYY